MTEIAGWLYRVDDWGDGYERGRLIRHPKHCYSTLRDADDLDAHNLTNHLRVGWELVFEDWYAYYIKRKKDPPSQSSL